MATISIRGLNEELTRRLKKEAAATQKSVNQLVLDLLTQHVGLDKKKRNLPTNTMTWMNYLGDGMKKILTLFKEKLIQKDKLMMNFGNE